MNTVLHSIRSRLNSYPLSAAYMRQWTGSSLVQIMACRLFGAKPLSKPMLGYCQLDSWEQVSVKFESEFYYFHSSKCIWKCRLPKWRPFCPGGDELIAICCTYLPIQLLLMTMSNGSVVGWGALSTLRSWVTQLSHHRSRYWLITFLYQAISSLPGLMLSYC